MRQIAQALMLSAALGYQTDQTVVPSTTVSTDNLKPGYSVESKYWVETIKATDQLVVQLTTMVPYESLNEGQIVQSYLQFLYGQNDSGKDTWDMAVCSGFFTSFATIEESTFAAHDSYLDLRGAMVYNSSKGYDVFMTASIPPDDKQDWTVDPAGEGSEVYCTIGSCFFTCKMQRPLTTSESDKDVQFSKNSAPTVFGGFRIYET